MAEKKKTPKEAANIFHSIMKAAVKGNPKPKKKKSKPKTESNDKTNQK